MGMTMDTRGIKPSSGGGDPVPPGKYVLEVTGFEEKKSSKGDYMVQVDFEVVFPHTIEERVVKGSRIRFHNVTFKPLGMPGAGIAIHFLKSLGEPWEEDAELEIEPANWVGKLLLAKVEIEFYDKKDGTPPRPKNVIRFVDPVPAAVLKQMGIEPAPIAPPPVVEEPEPPAAKGTVPTQEEIPF